MALYSRCKIAYNEDKAENARFIEGTQSNLVTLCISFPRNFITIVISSIHSLY